MTFNGRWMCVIGLACLPVQSVSAQSPTFDIYWVDVEGGAATLLVSPTESPCWSTPDFRRTTTVTRNASPPPPARPA